MEAGLAASGQETVPIETTYRHLGQVCEGTEYQVAFRTTGDRREVPEKHLVDNHPYDSPEVIAFTIDVGRAEYLDWITRATR